MNGAHRAANRAGLAVLVSLVPTNVGNDLGMRVLHESAAFEKMDVAG
jgi:hypothetical protein